jgi:mannose-6-phosphate isomerase
MKLERKYVEKPWGRSKLPPTFENDGAKRIGEVWFKGAGEQSLLIKYLFTSERLSIQVHPGDSAARARGLPHGKSECWFILHADDDAVLGLGLTHQCSAEELRRAALDGSIEHLIDWRPVRPGDFFMVPAGTIHAIGSGVTLVEIQQNSDVTYRLYDYGRPRELHLDDALAVATRAPYPQSLAAHVSKAEDRILVERPEFSLCHSHGDCFEDQWRWVVPLEGDAFEAGVRAGAGECLLVEPGARVEGTGRRLIASSPKPRSRG